MIENKVGDNNNIYREKERSSFYQVLFFLSLSLSFSNIRHATRKSILRIVLHNIEISRRLSKLGENIEPERVTISLHVQETK